MTMKSLTGDEAAAWAARLSRVKVVAAYPITPQTVIVETLAKWTQSGELDSEYIMVESEHSAMSAAIGASLAGVRSFTASSSQGLFYMYEMISWAAGSRLPIVAAMVNRALAPPWNIWSDHLDVLSTRDQGWIQLWARNNQDVVDSIIQAYKIAEHEAVQLPVMVSLGAMTLSHVAMPVDLPDLGLVDEFLSKETKTPYLMDPMASDPVVLGNLAMPEEYVAFRESIDVGMENAKNVITQTAKEFEEMFGRWHGGLLNEYRTDDAEIVVMALGAVAEEAEAVADLLRKEDLKVGAVNVRVTRPFPKKEIVELAKNVEKIVVIDRDLSAGFGGILAGEVRAALHEYGVTTPVVSKIAGLGGKDILPDDIKSYVMCDT